jgi:predicted nuclease of predicted toxin-antitoxin system
MKLLIDMNLSPRWVALFTTNHIEAIHWSSIGAVNAPDSEIIHYAAEHDYAVFTHDLDFGTILALTHTQKPSVIQIRMGDVFPDSTSVLILSALHQFSAQIEKGALLTIDPHKTRVNLLPL